MFSNNTIIRPSFPTEFFSLNKLPLLPIPLLKHLSYKAIPWIFFFSPLPSQTRLGDDKNSVLHYTRQDTLLQSRFFSILH